MITASLENSNLSGVIVAALIALVIICVAAYCLWLQLKWRGQRHNRPIWGRAYSYYSKNFRTESAGLDRNTLPPNFHSFICRHVIDIFNQQRKERYQFAALFFIDQDVDLSNINTRVSFYTTNEENERCLTHASYPFWPNDPQDFGNFMVARPEPLRGQHAEEILLEHFPTIWEVYQQRKGRPPKYVILYTWTMPCSKKCTPKLIRCITSSNEYTESTKFIVAYTIHWCKEIPSDIEHSKELLRNHDVIVENVNYDKTLPPSLPSSVEATPPPTDCTSHRPYAWNESDTKLTLDKLQALNLDDDKPLTSMTGVTNIAQDVPPQRSIGLPFNSDSPWEGLSQAESTEGDLSLLVPQPMHPPYRSESPWEGLSQSESTEGDLNLNDENEWPLLTQEQRI